MRILRSAKFLLNHALIGLLGCLPLPSWAQEAAVAERCDTEPCLVQRHEAVRAEVEQLYADIALILAAHERPALRNDQAQWRTRSRELCQKQARDAGVASASSAYDSQFYTCQIQQGFERRQQLRHWLMNGYRVE